MKFVKPIIALALLLGGAGFNATASAECLTLPLQRTDRAWTRGIEGETRLCSSKATLKAKISVTGLEAGGVYSAWWVYFDDPGACLEPYACRYADLKRPIGDARELPDGTTVGPFRPQGIIGRMTSAISPHTGELTLKGKLRKLRAAPGSGLWIVLMAHGPADTDDPMHFARQMLTPELRDLGEPHMGMDETRWPHRWAARSSFELNP